MRPGGDLAAFTIPEDRMPLYKGILPGAFIALRCAVRPLAVVNVVASVRRPVGLGLLDGPYPRGRAR